MHRLKPAIIAAIAVLVLAVGSVFAVNQPQPPAMPENATSSHEQEEQDETPPSEADIAHALERLEASGLATDAATLTALADTHGLGGAVRLIAWADETGLSVDELEAMRAEGKGWGVIARELGTHPGIGSIMGRGGENGNAGANGAGQGRGLGREGAPGQQKQGDGSDD